VQISTQAVRLLSEMEIPIAYLSYAGRMVAFVDPLDTVSSLVRRKQVHILEDPAKALELAVALITAKILNQRKMLQRNAQQLDAAVLRSLEVQAEEVGRAKTMDALRGHEGQAAALYFKNFPLMLKNEKLAAELAINGRQKHPARDPINSCLSMAYAMLTGECTAALRVARLEPSIGCLHVSAPGRPALALDLMEPFRPLIGDSVTLSAFNRGELAEGHFSRTSSGCLLTKYGRTAFFQANGRRMVEETTHFKLGYRMSYRRMLSLHAKMVAAWIIGDIHSLHFLVTR
jgi:CRISP-associated protein Cas1